MRDIALSLSLAGLAFIMTAIWGNPLLRILRHFKLGKIIRIDPTQTTASATAEMCAATEGQPAGYRIPADNPFVGSSSTCDEIVHYGMRNPWRISFDKVNGDLFIADVPYSSEDGLDLYSVYDAGRSANAASKASFDDYPVEPEAD